jgi:hypothetical protein
MCKFLTVPSAVCSGQFIGRASNLFLYGAMVKSSATVMPMARVLKVLLQMAGLQESRGYSEGDKLILLLNKTNYLNLWPVIHKNIT